MKVKRETTRIGVAGLAAALVAGLALASAPADAKPNPYLKSDNTWISLSGTVRSVSPDTFLLDYGKGAITVEMDDGDRDADAYALIVGDEVTVHGMIDDDFFEARTIEAGSVYVKKLGTTFYASSFDEEDAHYTYVAPVVSAFAVTQGRVASVSSEEFTLDDGVRTVTVEVEEMAYDPLDDEGYQRIEPGDIVRVFGTIDDDFFEGREIVADSVITILKRPDSSAAR